MKKGFTLVEIIAVVIILGILGLVGTLAISGTLQKNRTKLYETQIHNIEESAKIWAGKNVFSLPETDGEYITITLGFLKQEGLVEQDITNPLTDEKFSNDLIITITRENNGYTYKVLEDSGTNQ